MLVNIKKVDACKRLLEIEVPEEITKQKFDTVYQELGKTAKIPGFRPGKIPRDILEKHHAPLARQKLLEELIPSVYEQALKENNLVSVGLPEIFDVKLDSNRLSFKANVEVKPEIKLNKYKGLELKRKKTQVTDEEIQKAIESLKCDKNMVLDDKFSRGLGYFALADLKEAVRQQLFVNFDNQAHQDIETQIIKQLLSHTDFDVPQSLAKRQLERLVKEAKMNLMYQGASKEEAEAKEKELIDALKDVAMRDIKIYFILEAIAKQENIPIDSSQHLTRHVMEFLLREANWQETS